jgi:hypothetical protein
MPRAVARGAPNLVLASRIGVNSACTELQLKRLAHSGYVCRCGLVTMCWLRLQQAVPSLGFGPDVHARDSASRRCLGHVDAHPRTADGLPYT